MMPPNSLLCQQCPYRRDVMERDKNSKSAFGSFLDAFNNANKKTAMENGMYAAAIKEVLDKWIKRHGWNLLDIEKEVFIEDIKNIKV